MKININAIEIEITPAIKEYLEKKLGMLKKLLVKYEVKDTVMAKAEIGKITKHHHAGLLYKAEVHLVAGKNKFNASATADDLYAAIDDVKDELNREIIAKKDRSQTLTNRGGRKLKKMMKGLKRFEPKL